MWEFLVCVGERENFWVSCVRVCVPCVQQTQREMRHKRSLVGVEFFCGVWVLCVLFGSTTASSGRTRSVAPFVNKSVLICRGGSSATEDATTARKRRSLFRRDLNDESVDENETNDGENELKEEPNSNPASKNNRWWQKKHKVYNSFGNE